MLTISQLASYAGVTVRTVRHYHQIGLLAEPERDHSGYRSYDTAAVVRLIRIRVLADAGVPLARVQELLDAGPDEFARAVGEIDKALSADIRRLQATASGSPSSPPAITWPFRRSSWTTWTGCAGSASARPTSSSSGTPGSCSPRRIRSASTP